MPKTSHQGHASNVLIWIAPAFFAACSSSEPQSSQPVANAQSLTYYRDIKPLVDSKCGFCHTAGGIAPFPLSSFDDVFAQKDAVVLATSSGIMPPWPPDDRCTDYAGDRSLTQAQIELIGNWVQEGAEAGDPADYVAPTDNGSRSLSRVDRTLAMSEPYTPQLRPDEYRCFLLDWLESADKFITGFSVTPGDPAIVHHVLAFIAGPGDVASYQAYDDADPGPGYTCFGGPRATGATEQALAPLVGAWVPGAVSGDFPTETGIAIAPGSKIVLQVHYNTLNAAPAPDQTQIQVKLDDSVTKAAYVLPFTDPSWVRDKTMNIPAGAADAMHSFAYDAATFASKKSAGAIDATRPFTIYSAALHMHLHGTHATLNLQQAGGANACLLEIPHWDFHWQGSYAFTSPKVVNPGDRFNIECHWNNTAENQPTVGGQPLPVVDLNWGEGTTDEMCLGFVYATQ